MALNAGLVLLAACYAILAARYALQGGVGHLDFFGIWSWARFEIERPAALIYDHPAQQAFLRALDPAFAVPMPFPYPPVYLLLIRPLGWLSYPLAQGLWSGTTLLAYLAAAWSGPRMLLLALLAPASAINLIYGQNGFLTAALLVGGIRLAPSRPVLGGAVLGLLAYKPQFGLLVAIALASAGLWRALLAAAASVVVFAGASVLAFGLEPWLAWFRSMPAFMAVLDAERARLLPLMPTALAGALALGASDSVARFVQAAVTLVAAVTVWLAFRRRDGHKPGRPAAAALAVAALLASPYAFLYDLTLVAAGAVLILAEPPGPSSFSPLAGLILTLALLLPAAMFLNMLPPLPVATVVNGAVLAVIVMRISRRRIAVT